MNKSSIRFGSVCSGIEAASVAWEPLGWQAAWFSEIEKFPCAVLAHHYPDVPNLGDMTTLPDRITFGEIEAPDVFCGGTPCQAFSVAGKRESLADARGNLTLTFCEIADAIDTRRAGDGLPAAIIFWENVPGVFSTKDNAFGCFLARLCGGTEPLNAPDGWPTAGCVSGPRRTAAWRVLDAQYFGVAQRRRRVFVVASARDGFDPAAVLFEFDGVRRDTAPSREAGQVAPTIPARSLGGGGLGTDFDCDGGVVVRVPPVVGAMSAAGGTSKKHGHGWGQQDWENGYCVPVAYGGNHEAPIAAYSSGVKYEHYSHDYAHDRVLSVDGIAPAQTVSKGSGSLNVAVPVGVTIHGTDGTSTVASYSELAQCLRARTPGNIDNSSTTVVQQPVAYSTKLHNTTSNQAGKFYKNYTASLDANSPPPAVFASAAVAVDFRNMQEGEISNTMQAHKTGYSLNAMPSVRTAMQVRRLTPVECERLQYFPDNYTAIPWRTYQEAARKGISYETMLAQRGMTLRGPSREECPDGPRYKALGNSWAVSNVRWIGRRIDAELRKGETL